MSLEAPDPFPLRPAIAAAVEGRGLSEDEAHAAALAIVDGRAGPAQIAGLLVALRMKGETIEEITGFARALRERAERVPVDGAELVDTCGTGGDGRGTFNVSTVSALVAAGAGCRVAKHGNRSVAGRCGSAEVLAALGVPHEVGPAEAARLLESAGVAFLFAPRYHRATRHAALPRQEIGVRSLFNLVGPLTNPAGAARQLLGVFRPELTATLAEVLRRLGSTRCMVVHGADGLDEITLGGTTRVSELQEGRITTYDLDPRSLGFARRPLEDVAGGDPAHNARIALDVLEGRAGAPREIVLLNAAAVIRLAGRAATLADGVAAAAASIDTGAALAKLEALRRAAPDA